MSRRIALALALGTATLGAAGVSAAAAAPHSGARAGADHTFTMVRSAGAVAADCLPNAKATVKIHHAGPVEIMDVDASGLPKDTDFDLFVTQLPNAPFGASWYQGDLETGDSGTGHGHFVGRFSVETFVVAPGTGPAPSVHDTPIADATSNPAFAPIHTYHLGLWFNSPADADEAGCGDTVTPFNGEHNAGVQALSTRNFKDLRGPLRSIKS
jgi:hypothetical protein